MQVIFKPGDQPATTDTALPIWQAGTDQENVSTLINVCTSSAAT